MHICITLQAETIAGIKLCEETTCSQRFKSGNNLKSLWSCPLFTQYVNRELSALKFCEQTSHKNNTQNLLKHEPHVYFCPVMSRVCDINLSKCLLLLCVKRVYIIHHDVVCKNINVQIFTAPQCQLSRETK